MQTPLTHRSPGLVMLVVSMTALTTFGCRSTRSSFSQLPGMSWAAPEDEELYGSWSDDADPKLPPPSQSATPQLTTKSGTSVLSSAGKTQDDQPKVNKPNSANVSRAATAYPDTGYPTLQQPKSPASTATDSSRSLAGPSTSLQSRQPAVGGETQAAPPQRGFYGDSDGGKANGEYAESTEPAGDLPPPGRYSDPEPQYSRFSDSATGNSQYGSHNELPIAGSSASQPATAQQPLVSDSDSGYDPRGRQVSDVQEMPYVDDFAGSADGSPGLGDTTRQITEGIRDDYQRTTGELRDRLKEQATSLSGQTRELTNNVQGLARQAGDQIERGAAEMGRGVREGYSRFSNQLSESDEGAELGDLASETPTGATRSAADGQPTGNGQATESASYGSPASALPGASTFDAPASRGPEQTRASRSSQPWRPGSTGTLPTGNLDQTHYPSSGEYHDVEPVSYPANVSTESRLAPAYR